MSHIPALPERLIIGPRGASYEVHRAAIGIADLHGISIGFAAYRNGDIVPRLYGRLIVNIGSSTFQSTGPLLGPAAEVVIKGLPGLSVIMICVDSSHMIRGASTVEHRTHRSRWCFF